MRKKGFTMVELIAIIVIMACILLVVLPALNNTIKNSEEKKKEEALNNIYMAAENYLMANYEDYKIDNPGNTTYIYIIDLISNDYMSINTLNPNNDSSFSNKDAVKITRNEDGTFSYGLILVKTIYDAVINNYPDLKTDGNGCVTSTDSNYSYMGGCYLTGNPTSNYVWYSGFLWRIMGINADGTVRLITDENVTSISWGEYNVQNWDGSYTEDWLNNYFYPRLKQDNIIKETIWCNEITADENSARTECENNLSTEVFKVGLITLDEYNLAGGSSSYLNISQYQWTMTQDDNIFGEWSIDSEGLISSMGEFYAFGIRPVINIKSDTIITGGNGILKTIWSNESGPYILNEDKNVEITGKLNEKATSGEYVIFAEKKYRVIDKDSNGNTKLILDGYYEEKKDTPYIMTYGSSNMFSTTTGIGQKLNGDVLNWLTNNKTTEKAKLVNNYTWYQYYFCSNCDGFWDVINCDYKIALEEISTRSVQATVGLIRVGEMLSSQSGSLLTNGYITEKKYYYASTYWSMTIGDNNFIWIIGDDGMTDSYELSEKHKIRPVIVIKSDVEIISGTGTFSNPYQI